MENLTPESPESPLGHRRYHAASMGWLQQIGDTAIALACFYAFTVLRTGGVFPVQYQILAMIAALAMVTVYQWTRVYDIPIGHRLFHEARSLLKGWVIVIFLLAAIGFVTKTNESFSREVLLLWAVLGYGAQLVFHILFRKVMNLLRAHGRSMRRAILVGKMEPAADFANRLLRNPWLGIDPVGYVGVSPNPQNAPEDGEKKTVGPGLPNLGAMADLGDLIRSRNIDLAYITFPLNESDQIENAVRELMLLHVDVHWVPDMSALQLVNHSVREIEGQPVLCLSDSPIVGIRRWGKWLEDKILAILIIILVSPLLLAIGIAVKLTSKGPVLFSQVRAGLNGEAIKVHKFRSMVLHEESDGEVTQATGDDPRITPLGRFLRKSSMDELPQFFDVLAGRMSIVGPRPHALEHNNYYEKQIDAYMLRHRIKPGITGWAQVNGWRGETDKLEKMEMRVKYDLYYINNWSVALDLVIIALTVRAVFGEDNAY